ncbi:hypothetical protein NPIL_332921 [Nephila pilipes]|uniref:Uncharacterized protein n=1 Tax=Nephila pilipes TaxID=299642 RepID=A0A8X6PGK2_NEPPI|nr:hypothetical protein NPIL_332921 [Nephila pilipes]
MDWNATHLTTDSTKDNLKHINVSSGCCSEVNCELATSSDKAPKLGCLEFERLQRFFMEKRRDAQTRRRAVR